METKDVVIVVGMGQIGRPLLRILEGAYPCVGVDLEPVEVDNSCSVLHVCYPFQVPDFIGTTARYIEKYRPSLTIINSTVAPGTTRKIQDLAGDHLVAFSPVRGKHVRMEADMLRYKKFVGAPRPEAVPRAIDHFRRAGFRTDVFRTAELAELGKLLETTYLGILVGWAQEVERFSNRYGGSFEDVNSFIEEISFLPGHIFPGHIGGHCVMPNIAILRSQLESTFLDAVVESNERRRDRNLITPPETVRVCSVAAAAVPQDVRASGLEHIPMVGAGNAASSAAVEDRF